METKDGIMFQSAGILKEIQSVCDELWKRNTETTKDWYPETGGVLFIISAEKPISESELSLLKEIYLYSPEIAIVITK